MSYSIKDYKNSYTIKYRVGRIIWSIAWLVACSWTPPGMGIFYLWRSLWLRIFGAKIGRGVHVYPRVRVWQPWMLEMGDYSCLANGVDCYTADRVYIGENVVVSQGAFICTASHDITSPTFGLVTKPIVLSRNSWICAHAIVMPGIIVGEGAVVAAGAVVSKDVEPWTVVGGNPAREIKKRVLR